MTDSDNTNDTSMFPRIDNLIERYSKSADSHMRFHQRTVIAIVSFGAFNTGLIALIGVNNDNLNLIYIATAISAFVTIGTGLMTNFKSRELWVLNRSTQWRLKTEKMKYEARCGDYADLEEKLANRLFSEKVINIIETQRASWSSELKDD